MHRIFFKTLTQLYFFYSFLYYFTYGIKEGIKCDIFGDEMKKCWPMRQLRLETGGPLADFFKH